MKFQFFLAVVVVGVTCMGQAARAQAAAPSDDAQALVKQGQKLNSEGKQDEALKLYQAGAREVSKFLRSASGVGRGP